MTLSVPTPCPADYAAMAPTTHGRHCAACAKTVVDFTAADDDAVAAYLTDAAAGAVTCGRFRPDQLDRPLRGAPRVRRGWLASLTAGLVTAGAAATAGAQRDAPTLGRALVYPQPTAHAVPDSTQADLLVLGDVVTLPRRRPVATVGMVAVFDANTGASAPIPDRADEGAPGEGDPVLAVTVSPNPGRVTARLTFNTMQSEAAAPALLNLHAADGRLVFAQAAPTDGQELRLPDDAPAGWYRVELVSQAGRVIGRTNWLVSR